MGIFGVPGGRKRALLPRVLAEFTNSRGGGPGRKVLPPRGANATCLGARGETTEGGYLGSECQISEHQYLSDLMA